MNNDMENNFKDENKDFNSQEKVPEKKIDNFTKTMMIWLIVGVILISSLFGAFFGFVSAGVVTIFSSKISQYFPGLNLDKNDQKNKKQQIIIEDSAVIDVVDRVSPAVVSIVISKNVSSVGNNLNNPWGFFFDPFSQDSIGGNDGSLPEGQGVQKRIGGGSGFFIESDGYILTNRHVVEDEKAEYTVVTNDGKEYVAKVLARDPVRDVAIIKIEGNDFPVANLGDSDLVKIGQTVVAIGNSLGEFSNSVSRGIVSGLKRNISASGSKGGNERLTDIIQTDAAINSGNSGGPLLDINGDVIGVNVAIAQGAQSVGFALPVNQVKRIIDQVKNGTKITVPYLGVRYISIDSSVQKEAQLPFDYGVLVLRGTRMTDLAVIPGSPSDKAGIVENDIILEIDGKKITKDNQLGDMVSKYNVGDVVTLKIWHKGDTKDIQVKLEERKQ